MEATVRRRRMTVSLPDYAYEAIKKEAKRIGWSQSALAGEYILDAIYHTPNAETIAAIEEAKSGAELRKLDLSSFESFLKSLDDEVENS